VGGFHLVWFACLFCVLVIHSFCNAMSFPDFGAALKWRRPGKRRLIWAAYVCGLLAFACLVFFLMRMSVDATVRI
jgi:hypothetical protein